MTLTLRPSLRAERDDEKCGNRNHREVTGSRCQDEFHTQYFQRGMNFPKFKNLKPDFFISMEEFERDRQFR